MARDRLLRSKKSAWELDMVYGEDTSPNPEFSTDENSFVKQAGRVKKELEKTLRVGFLADVKQLLSNPELKRLTNIGTEIFSAFAPFIHKPTVFNGGKAFFKLGQTAINQSEIWSDEYFDTPEWDQPFNVMFTYMILKTLINEPSIVLKTANSEHFIKIITFEGVKYGWTSDTKTKMVRNIYVEASKVDQARASVKHALWEKFGEKSLIMKRSSVMNLDDSSGIVFEVDDAFHPLPSKMATEHSEYLKKCFDAGIRRSILLFGPPGTGKSTMARTLVQNLGLRSVRIRVEDVANLNNSALAETISLFEPDAIILDDFDRAHAQASLLETMEFFRRHVKLVIASANNRSNLDEAILRPGRFDELILVNAMDEAVVKSVLGEAFIDGFEDVKSWPIAFVEEYVQRRRFMDKDKAAQSMRELSERVSRLSRYGDAPSWSDITPEEGESVEGEEEGEAEPEAVQHTAPSVIPDVPELTAEQAEKKEG